MTGRTSGAEVTACISLAVGLFSGSLVPFFLLINADFAQAARSVAAVVEGAWTRSVLSLAALLMLLTATPEGAR